MSKPIEDSAPSTQSHGGMMNACYVYDNRLPRSQPELVTPDMRFTRSIYMNGSLTMDDGNSVVVWGFNDTTAAVNGAFPSPPIRVTQGQIVHTVLSVNGMMWAHTIHHHGIEPATESDGTGHISWDVSGGSYTYQWKAHQAGTYFYHCHTNTVLHVEMGMYGVLIVDPAPDPADPVGTRRVFSGGPTYDVEAVWACDEFDSSWHNKDWAAGTCGDDAGLNTLNPDYFLISGVDGAQSALNPSKGITATVSPGQTLLVRYINAGYYAQRIDFGGLEFQVVASDARPLHNPVSITSLEACSAERYDCLFSPVAGQSGRSFTVTVQYLHWVSGAVLGEAKTSITVA